MQPEIGRKASYSKQRLELELALIYQWFLLSDEIYHLKATEKVLSLFENPTQEIKSVLRELLQKWLPDHSLTHSQGMIQLILKYFETNERQKFLEIASKLLEQVDHQPSFSPEVLGRIYKRRAKTYLELKKYPEAIIDFIEATKLKPDYAPAFYGCGQTCFSLTDYGCVVAYFTKTISLNPDHEQAYIYRGLAHLQLRNLPEARKDFFQSWKQDSSRLRDGLMAEWLNIYERGIVPGASERLEMIAMANPKSFTANICLAVALWTQRKFTEAQKKLELTAPLNPTGRDAYSYYFWKGMIHAKLNEWEKAKGAIEIALNYGLPPVLLLALFSFSKDRTDFYRYYAEPLLARHKLLPSATNPLQRIR